MADILVGQRANHVVLLEPFWNYATELQAIGRSYRIGQKREVHVHQLIFEESFELYMLEIQKHKDDIQQAFLQSTQKEYANRQKSLSKQVMQWIVRGYRRPNFAERQPGTVSDSDEEVVGARPDAEIIDVDELPDRAVPDDAVWDVDADGEELPPLEPTSAESLAESTSDLFKSEDDFGGFGSDAAEQPATYADETAESVVRPEPKYAFSAAPRSADGFAQNFAVAAPPLVSPNFAHEPVPKGAVPYAAFMASTNGARPGSWFTTAEGVRVPAGNRGAHPRTQIAAGAPQPAYSFPQPAYVFPPGFRLAGPLAPSSGLSFPPGTPAMPNYSLANPPVANEARQAQVLGFDDDEFALECVEDAGMV
eukprot:TRINITY_DN9388_c0_g4_i1.p1 TRINITY_DN9388_c0_g4~~TRINITY_DN9388_c0_g4_i1.p1  ORF type:complete len:365 (-),score=112.72 TRINITY_DN9388_c0_g4_i1:484-1578(-)